MLLHQIRSALTFFMRKIYTIMGHVLLLIMSFACENKYVHMRMPVLCQCILPCDNYYYMGLYKTH